MKKIKLGLITSALLSFVFAYSQTVERSISDFITVGFSKTTSIVFPYSIASVDRGSQEVLVQKASGSDNILLVKAAKQNFSETNLTIVTSDGRLHCFVLQYDDQSPMLNIVIDDHDTVQGKVLLTDESKNQQQIQQYATLALMKSNEVKGLKTKRFTVKLEVTGIFIHQDVMYFRIKLSNSSRINYEIEQMRLFIRDQKKSKRTASQEIEVIPLYTCNYNAKIASESEMSFIVAASKFTIPENKYLAIQFNEKNGGRHIDLSVKDRDLLMVEILNSN
ncbi:conjugative transposon TraN protein [Flavobacterium sp. 9]|uniref:conjugative transposon protein TraN n=1 Tax=Flavobacterium sp. 9 TaxID=2035198 RepID=UPI000C19B929|nr:conjugative transposon protein TraN [Flavobacterium sp. 9]PIF34556.1 conjugative transposon TraN protein [Flavobacterium sp. 9]